jgi:hypothetical protein
VRADAANRRTRAYKHGRSISPHRESVTKTGTGLIGASDLLLRLRFIDHHNGLSQIT